MKLHRLFPSIEIKDKAEEENDRMRLEEMSEDEYDALPEEEKAAVDTKRLEIKKERIRKLAWDYSCIIIKMFKSNKNAYHAIL